ncbi:MAG: hypothetical protein KC609_06965 [Myxococcales bacterium]|nr:hypothetical protein [Myxococcales bacterium]
MTTHKFFIRLISTLAILTSVLASTASATVVIGLDKQTLVRDSDAVVIGKVVSIASYREKDTSIWTATRIDVTRVLRGRISKGIYLLKQPGGTLDGVYRRVPGVAGFALNETVLLFLESHASRGHVVMGMAQGKFTVVRDKTSQRMLAYRDLSDLTLVRRADSGRYTTLSPIEVKPYFYLDELIKAVLNSAKK